MNICTSETLVIHKYDISEMKLLSKDVVDCMEMLDAFSLDGKYIDINESDNRMSSQEAQEIKNCYYSIFSLFYKKKKINRKTIKRRLKPIKTFIVGIFRNGTPAYRFKSMSVDKAVSDDYILDEFAAALEEKLYKEYR